MPASNSPALLVARFLYANRYNETLEAFVKEAGLSEDAGTTGPGDWTIENILEEKKQYDASLRFEKKENEGNQGWTVPAPSAAVQPQDFTAATNILCISGHQGNLFVAGADRNYHGLSDSPPYHLVQSYGALHGSPILSLCHPTDSHVLSTSMAGQVMLHRTRDGTIIDTRRDHLKYAVQVVSAKLGNDHLLVATAGWDSKVHIYNTSLEAISSTSEQTINTFFNDPIHTIILPTNPESLIFARHPTTDILHLVLSRRDSTHLYYYSITIPSSESGKPTPTVNDAGRQNLAPHSNAWVSFTPSCLAVCPTDPTLVAVATSHLPHMKLLLVRLLFPDSYSTASGQDAEPRTQATAARAALALQDREEAAIHLHVSTLAPQTPYSTPQVVWRPDGSGVWVNGDDGAIRGIEVQTGKVISVLKGHEAGSKVRTLWAGQVADVVGKEGSGKELLVSGGFDRKLLVWEVGD